MAFAGSKFTEWDRRGSGGCTREMTLCITPASSSRNLSVAQRPTTERTSRMGRWAPKKGYICHNPDLSLFTFHN